jgi:hypothetical protein
VTASRLIGAVIALGVAAGAARADVSAAARAFSDGQAAQLEGAYERAAQSFELAFNIAPTKEALRSAIRARQLAGQLPRAATLAQVLLAQFSDDPTSLKLANDVIGEARLKLGRITVTCAPQCTLAIGGRATSLHALPTHIVFAVPGRAVLEITFGGDRSVVREIAVKQGDDLALPVSPPPPSVTKPSEPPATAASAREPRRGMSPYVAITGGALTLVLASITTWSALDTVRAHDAYAAAPTAAGWTDGRSKQLRTNLLLGGTIAAGVGTSLITLFWTRWHDTSRPPPDVAVTPQHGGVTLSLGSRF